MPFETSSADRGRRIGLALVIACIVVSLPGVGSAATYFVDPTAGSNANSGTTASTPWANPPGTRTATSSGFWSSTWGATSTANKIKCGDVILLKGGSTQTSAKGGAWWINPTYYTANCTTGSRISIRIATNGEWSGSSGPFTVDGTGVTPSVDSLFGPTDRAPALITVFGVDFVELKGLSNSQRIVVTDSTQNGITAGCSGPGCAGSSVGFRGDWWDVNRSVHAISFGRLNNWNVSNVTVNLIQSGAVETGWNNDHIVDRGAFVNVTVHDSGCGSPAWPGCTDNFGDPDQFFFTGGRNLWCVNCTSYNSGERGANTGVIGDANMGGDFVYRFRNYVAFNNGATCNVNNHWCSGLGIDTSGNDWASNDRSRNIIVGAHLYGNKHGGEGTYGGGYQEVWHATSYNNGTGGGANHRLRAEATNQFLFNSIDPSGYSYDAGTANGGQPQKQFTPTAMNNCLRPNAANSEALGANFGGWPGMATYAAPPSWIGATNKIGLTNCNPQFVNLAGHDVRLQAGSSAIDAGRFLLLANGAGSNATTVSVKANGGSVDPRYYFISSASYLDAQPDTIQLQNASCASGTPALAAGRAVITGMTATTITLDRACSWANNAGVHLPWTGSAPDMGALEFASGGPPAPTLLSVEPVTP